MNFAALLFLRSERSEHSEHSEFAGEVNGYGNNGRFGKTGTNVKLRMVYGLWKVYCFRQKFA